MIIYLLSFLVGGLICASGQLFLDFSNYTPAHLLVLLVVIGCCLTGLGIYSQLIDIAGAGVTVPVMNFGFILTKGVLMEVEQSGVLGLFTGALEIASAGVSAAIIISFLIAVIFNPQE
ncbi:stage V sporulation protein AE [Halanaerobacter jeridensis]|uniref:Stage V sporulation protein AE n=1 Tax=Halanaerobacter jeridensis TaxID=706427 RepID=A0A938XTI3_9FIRM|nr:stage V sporulation protein AE [Halanaerobacter jeridensis]MBM7555272.1 stage V sporulation protein AE [Halanaerobacter jeridensis]